MERYKGIMFAVSSVQGYGGLFGGRLGWGEAF